jgi:predicted O-methyltransferase YrrM
MRPHTIDSSTKGVQATPTFSYDWFSQHIPMWEMVMRTLETNKRFLEIGSFEGKATCWMLENALDDAGEIVAIDTWEGSPEFARLPIEVIRSSEETFRRNVDLARSPRQTVTMMKGTSYEMLAQLIGERQQFDLIYVDGSHQASDTLTDAVMAWPLLRERGVMIFDDYLWDFPHDLRDRPKLAIDTFVNLWSREMMPIACGPQFMVRRVG